MTGTVLSPFQEESVVENYFPGTSRNDVLDRIHEAMRTGVTLMVLTGEEGSGKTMLCRVLLDQVSSRYKNVYFPLAVDSYEEVVCTIFRELDLDEEIDFEDHDVDLLLDKITVFLLTESVELLLIFDDAESIFLATLERIRKLLERISTAGAPVHLLFSGGKTFLENCEQVAICDFQNSDELHITLEPLSKTETAEYLQDCAARLPGKASRLFTSKVVDSIYSFAKGNFRETNLLGKEAVQIQEDDTSFMVLLDKVDEDSDNPDRFRLLDNLPVYIRQYTAYLPWAGAAVSVFLLYLIFSGGAQEEKMADRSGDQSVLVEAGQGEPIDRQEKMAATNSVQQETAAEVTPPSSSEEKPDLASASGGMAGADGLAPSPVFSSPAAGTEPAGKGERLGGEKEDKVAGQVVTPAAKKDAPLRRVIAEGEQIARQKIAVQGSSELKDTAAEPPRKIHKVRQKVRKPGNTSAPTYADLLYDQRVSAGSGWIRGATQGKYTVQLMALASGAAEENLKKMLGQERYRQEAGNFYIVKKKTSPARIFVFYGEYPSMETARLVKNSLPGFLRDHKPYALSIEGAMAKINE